jgi:PAS domain S-box-containing protein
MTQLSYAAMVDVLDTGVAVLDASGIVESLNPMGEQLLGVHAAVVIGRPLLSMPWNTLRDDETPLPREEHPALVVLRTGERQEDVPVCLLRPDGSAIWLAVSAAPLTREGESRPYAVVAAFRDITRRRRAEAALSASEARFRAVAECVGVGLVLTDLDGHALYVNARMTELTGYSREEMIGANLGRLLLPMDAWRDMERRTAARVHGEAEVYEIEHLRRDGTRFWVEVSGAPYRDDQGHIVGTVGTVTDVNERKAVETMKAQLVGVVSHELRTPLGAIASALAILSRSLVGLEARPAQMLEMATRNTHRLLELVSQLLDVERLEAGVLPLALEPRRAADLLQAACDLLRPSSDAVQVHLVAEPSTARVLADADRVTQCLINLLGNAIKFSPRGGTITLSAEERDGEVRFSIRDEGHGMPPRLTQGLFNRFVQVDSDDDRRRKGAGLGLVISRAIVEQHGGRIWVESEEGKGSIFCFTLRAADPAPATARAS